MTVLTHTQTRARRVVIIDDTRDLRDLLSLALTKGGFDVVGEAGDGSQGIEVVRRDSARTSCSSTWRCR